MKRIAVKILLFGALLALIKLPFWIFYQNETDFRRRALAAADYNAVFIGSSRAKRSVIPAYFDSLAAAQTRSYNAGGNYFMPPRTVSWCAELLDAEPRLKYVFIELSGDALEIPVGADAWTTASLAEYRAVLTELPFEKSAKYHDRMAVNFFKPPFAENWVDYNGSLAEVWNAPELPRSPKISVAALRQMLAYNRQAIAPAAVAPETGEIQIYWEKIEKLLARAENKGVRIFFFIPPRLQTAREAAVVNSLYRRLPSANILRAAHDDERLYQIESSLEEHHIDRAGARLFTESLAAAFRSAVEQSKTEF